ncbi:DUF3208 domain-containing protein [Meiothermus sp. QL-1]|uniref:DUF3208 domain-containing protein n=1 Tax=Meiothermus sp. QL-1 TaxID=2058095 RepID=UPI000E0A5F8A|nr:DUF3208 domain-containing protein [Meiothermus sp. QL-1]RDI96394.1 DUF3208 domain-containing protein [Meiothermus sp. QL-1]
MKAIRLFQGYLWHPKSLLFEPRAHIPPRLGEVYVLIDKVRPPVSFFEDGTPTETQQFYQLTLLVRSDKEPAELKPLAAWASRELDAYLQATPKEVGWQILEDLRPL